MAEEMLTRALCYARLADGLGEDYRAWTRMQGLTGASRVFITSPANTGKTAFLAETLFPFAAAQGRGVLYLGTASACREMAALLRAQGLEEHAGVFRAASGVSVAVVEYGAFLSFEKRTLPSAYYVVADEAQFFLEDAPSEPRTGLLLERLGEQFRECVMLFLSRALCDAPTVLSDALEKQQRRLSKSLPLVLPPPIYYRNRFCAGRYALRFYAHTDELAARMRQTPSEEKWLVLTASRQAAERLHRALRERGADAALLTESSPLWRELCERERFDRRILIAARLPEGVRLDDAALRHLALPFCTRGELMQHLGARRLQAGETLELCLALPNVQTLGAQLRRTDECMAAVERVLAVQGKRYYDAPSAAEQTALLQEYWLAGKPHINALFRIGDDRALCPNPLAYEKLRERHAFFTQLRGAGDDPQAYPRLVQQWLEDELGQTFAEAREASLPDFLRARLGCPVPKEEQEAFYQAFQQSFRAHCCALCGDDEVRLRALLGIRKGKTQRKASMNRGLAALALPYEVKKEQGCWVVRQR